MQFETDRLKLKQMHLADAFALYNIFKHPDFFYAYTHQDNANLVFSSIKYAFLAEAAYLIAPQHHKIMGVFEKNKDELIGAAVLTDMKQTEAFGLQGEVGYFIDVRHQGKGYAYEAISGLIQHVELDSIRAVTAEDNIASQKILQKLGLVITGKEENSQYKTRSGAISARLHYRGMV